MSRKINITRFENLVKTAEEYNGRNPGKRFYSIQSREGSILVFGMYDYVSKKYALSRPFEDVNKVFDEIETMLEAA